MYGGNPINKTDPKGTNLWITGGPTICDHAGVVVTVRDGQGKVIGYLTADYSASGYMGSKPAPGNVWTGIPATILLTWTPGGDYAATTKGMIVGTSDQDNRTVDFILVLSQQKRDFFTPTKPNMVWATPVSDWATYGILYGNICWDFVHAVEAKYTGKHLGYPGALPN
jgi:hypothetical protein